MLNLILSCLLIVSLGGIAFLVARKLPLLASLASDVVLDNGQAPVQAVLAKEKIKLLARKFLIMGAHKAISFLCWLETAIVATSEKARKFYRRQRHQEGLHDRNFDGPARKACFTKAEPSGQGRAPRRQGQSSGGKGGTPRT